MNGFEKRAQQKKQDILIAAKKLFWENGTNKITVKDIANAANVSPVTIFKYFDTKEKLLEETLLYHMEEFMNAIEKIVYSEDNFPYKLKKAMFFKSEEAKKVNKEVYATFTRYISAGDERFIFYVSRNRVLTNKIFEQGKKEGFINKNLTDAALELYMQLISQGISINDNVVRVIPLIDDIMDLICYGFAGKK